MSAEYSTHDGGELWVCELPITPYREAILLQERVRSRRHNDEVPDALLLLEHPPVYTRGRRSDAAELTLGEEVYRARGIEVVDTDRGGRLTYHGPGQLVGYPIMRIEDVHGHLRRIEDAIVATLAEQGIQAHGRPEDGPDYTGVWVAGRKIASIGVHVSRGVSTHGFALNLDNSLEPFSWIVACGLPDVTMTSLARELAALDPQERADGDRAWSGGLLGAAIDRVRARIAHHFCEVHSRRLRTVLPDRLGLGSASALASRSPARTWSRTPGGKARLTSAARGGADQDRPNQDSPGLASGQRRAS
jgi:lipoyl(octanoyl) transferase